MTRSSTKRSTKQGLRFASTPRRKLSGCYRLAPGPTAQPSERLLLRVDLDGPTPLGVLSVVPDDPGAAATSTILIARIEQRRRRGNRLELRARVSTASRAAAFGRPSIVEVVIEHALASPPAVELHLIDGRGRRRGCWSGLRYSSSFRHVDVDICLEHGAQSMPVYDTHQHPVRPAQLRPRQLSVRSVYDEAGVELEYDDATAALLPAGDTQHRWTLNELHDSMALHWASYSREPQWKLWLLMACRYERSRVAGLMFDTDPNGPEGASRRGVAIFTRCEYFHDPAGVNAQANPPPEASARRELLFNTVHEIGHAFNLPHPFERKGRRWSGPDWFGAEYGPAALTWMNYPNQADPNLRQGAPWFYRRFRFGFLRRELLFLRHAPEHCVVMGGANWLTDHARAVAEDPGLELRIQLPGRPLELGEPVLAELHLRNRGDQAVRVHDLEAGDAGLQVSVTGPVGRPRPWSPFVRLRAASGTLTLAPRAALVTTLDLSLDASGPTFAVPGRHRIEVSLLHPSGRASRAQVDLLVRCPDAHADSASRLALLPGVARVLYCRGTRVLDEIVDKLRWIRARLGPRHPISLHVAYALFRGLARPARVITPSRGIQFFAADPEFASEQLYPSLSAEPKLAASTLGVLRFCELARDCAEALRACGRHRQAQELASMAERATRDSIARARLGAPAGRSRSL